ncbi:PleD family two-component system response regulator [candidate division KSB1 bacterium]
MEKPHVLLAEDDMILSQVIAEELESGGYRISQAKDGEAAVDLIKKKRPDLVLLDILMPKMNGMEVLENVKASSTTRGIPVIMLTMLSSDDDIKRALRLGAEDYIVKSQHAVGEIVEKVNEFFDKGARLDAGTKLSDIEE